MDAPNCPTCGKPMETNPPRENQDGSWGAPGEPMFVCVVDDKAHDDARKVRADECKRLLLEAAANRETQETTREAARKIGVKEAAELAATAEER